MDAKRKIDPRRIEILDDKMVEILRKKTSAERVAMAMDLAKTMRLLLESHLRYRHPDWDDNQISREIARRRSLGTK
jgi:hypothetical protein